jgi:hypothetical protein
MPLVVFWTIFRPEKLYLKDEPICRKAISIALNVNKSVAEHLRLLDS